MAAAIVMIENGQALKEALASARCGSLIRLAADIRLMYESVSARPDARLTLDLNGYTLAIERGRVDAALRVPAGATLAIEDKRGGGRLTATTGAAGASAIGAGPDGACGEIEIHGGTIRACGGPDGAGIGGDSGATVTIHGGTVESTGGMYGAGIGGSKHSGGGDIIVRGGTLTIRGGDYAAGIGGGYAGDGGRISIYGGMLDVKTGYLGAAIGGGYRGGCGTITIHGGIIVATAEAYRYLDLGVWSGAAIGSGVMGGGGSINIHGGMITARGAAQAAALGGGTDASGAAVAIHGGEVVLSGAGGYRGTLIGAGAADARPPQPSGSLFNGGRLTLSGDGKLWIPPGERFVNEGVVSGTGYIGGEGRLVNRGIINTLYTGGLVYTLPLHGKEGPSIGGRVRNHETGRRCGRQRECSPALGRLARE
ncbi:hypothetical protein [Paenibacillus daejeonensis]|uniref:hypothetical protein n=1 Tax=Paenibacillus daejeonensis TaxID=135193 RepID=UPI0003A649A5|nr:hypothetical protein [Paenibacillus daejeonensis]